jgi:hypothetical protein
LSPTVWALAGRSGTSNAPAVVAIRVVIRTIRSRVESAGISGITSAPPQSEIGLSRSLAAQVSMDFAAKELLRDDAKCHPTGIGWHTSALSRRIDPPVRQVVQD